MTDRLRGRRWWAYLPALGTALYACRVLAELGAKAVWPSGAILGGLAGLAVGAVLARYLLRDFSPPALLLWAYVLYPAYDLRVAALVGLAALLAGLAARCPRPCPRLLDGGVFAAALSLYWLTLSPGLLPADAGEFQIAAATLGVAHPPGYPLYTLLGKGFTLLIPANPMRGLNLFSAVTTALAVMLAGRAARRLSGDAWAGLAAAATLAVAASVWSTATQASIRPLTAFFTALCVERLATYRRTLDRKALTGFALAFGLGLAHHPSLVFPGLFFVLYLPLIDPRLIRQPRRWPAPLGALALGFVPWLYLPVRAAMGAPLTPDNLATWGGFWDHVLARGFSGDLFFFRTPAELADRARIWLNILALQWHPLLPVLACLAGVNLLRRDWRAFLMLGGGFALHSLITMTYRAPQTVEYLIPAYVLLAIALGAGLAPHIVKTQPRAAQAWATVPALLLAGLVALGARDWPSFAALARDDSTRDYAASLLEQAPPGAVILSDWHHATPLWALQEIEGQRPDVAVIYVFPEGAEPLAQTWVRRIGDEIAAHPLVVTGFHPAEFAATPYFFEPLAGGWLVRQSPRRDLPPSMTPLHPVTFDNGLALAGMEIVGEAVVGQTFEVRLAWRVDAPLAGDVAASVHFANPNLSISNADVLLPTGWAGVGDILISQHVVGMPPYGQPSPLDRYTLMAALYTLDPDGRPQPIPYAQRFYFYTLAEVEVKPPAWPAPTAHPRHVVFANGAVLRGVDRDGLTLYLHALRPDGTPRTIQTSAEAAVQVMTDQIAEGTPRLGPWTIPLGRAARMPDPRPGQRYVTLGGHMALTGVTVSPGGPLAPGDHVTVDLTLIGARPLTTDDVVKVDLIGADYAWRSQSDHIPATGAIPTLKWLYGWRIADRHRLTVPADASTTTAHAEMLVYDHFTGQVLPLLDVELAGQGIAVPLYNWPPQGVAEDQKLAPDG